MLRTDECFYRTKPCSHYKANDPTHLQAARCLFSPPPEVAMPLNLHLEVAARYAIRPVLVLALLGGLCLCGQADASDSLRQTAFVMAVKNAVPAVVNIHGRKTVAADAEHPDKEVRGMGTGVIIDPRGYILTNFHVVDGVKVIQVTNSKEKVVTARLIAHDQATDLAVIKISSQQDFPVIKIGSSQDLLLAEPVIAVGNAYGYHHSVTRGHHQRLAS